MEGGRLSRPRHCSKGVQPVPEAVYRSGCRDKHHRLPAVRFEPGSSHTAVRHVTARPLRHWCKGVVNDQRCLGTSRDMDASFSLVCDQTQMQPYIVTADPDTDGRTRMCPPEVVSCAMRVLNEC